MASPRSPQRSGVLSSTDQSATPLTFSLQLPFILLGVNTTEASDDIPSISSTKTDPLASIYGALEGLGQGVQFAIWEPTIFDEYGDKPKVLKNEADRVAMRKDIKTRKEAWRAEETQRWAQLSRQGKWILRSPPGSDEDASNACGVLGPWKGGDALLSDHEVQALGPQTWFFPFLLQRFGVGSPSLERFEREVRNIYQALGKLDGFKHEQGTTFKIVIGERCWPCVEYSPPHDGMPVASKLFSSHSNLLPQLAGTGGSVTLASFQREGKVEGGHGKTGWGEDKISNLFAVWLVLEKEILSMGAVDMLSTYWPLSHSLTYSAIGELRRMKIALMHSILARIRRNKKKTTNHPHSGGDKGRWQAEWERLYTEWIQRLKRQDDEDQEKQEVLARERKGWWTEIEQLGMGNIVRRIQELETNGQRVGISFSLKTHSTDSETDSTSTTPSPQSSPPSPKPAFDNPPNKTANIDNTPPNTPREPFPHIPSLSFPIPVRTLSTTPLLTYLSFLTHVILFATENTSEAIAQQVDELGDRVSAQRQSVARNVKRAAMMVDMKKESVEELVKLVGEKRRIGVDVDIDGGNDGDEKVKGWDGEVMKDVSGDIVALVERRRDAGRAGMEEWLRRYERSSGFRVPRRMELLALLEGGDGTRDGGLKGKRRA